MSPAYHNDPGSWQGKLQLPLEQPCQPSLCWRGQPSSKRQLVSMGLTLRGAGMLVLVPALLSWWTVQWERLLGKGWRDSFSGFLLWVWMLSYLPICHFTLQDCCSGNGWLVGVNGCLQWFRLNYKTHLLYTHLLYTHLGTLSSSALAPALSLL